VVCVELKKADILQDEQLQRLRESPLDLVVSNQIQEDVWSKEKVPKYRLCRSKRHKRFKLTPVLGVDGGWDMSMYPGGEVLIGGDFVLLEQSKFTKGTVVYEMLGDVEALLIEEGKMGEDVELQWVNKELQRLPRWSGRSLDNIHGALWTSVRKNKGLTKVSSRRENAMVLWKIKSKGYVCIM